MTMGERVTSRRQALGLSLSECARRARLKRQYLWQIEQGGLLNPSVRLITRLACALETSVDALVGKRDEIADVCDLIGISVEITHHNRQLAWHVETSGQVATIFWPADRWLKLCQDIQARLPPPVSVLVGDA